MGVRNATAADAPLICDFIRQLAEYEKLAHEASPSEEAVRAHLGSHFEALIAEDDEGVPVGFALWFTNYSTFLTKPGIYLEDLFVRPDRRGEGFGLALLSSLARIAHERGCGRLEWSVLDWNEPAIAFYQKIGARPQDGWTTMRMTESAIAGLAKAVE